MSLSATIPQFNSLPSLFTSELISKIQYEVNVPSDLGSILTSYQPNFPPSKSLPIVKQQFFKKLVQKQAVQQFIINLFSFMTNKSYTIQEKVKVSNVIYKLLYLISQIGMTKQKWKNTMNIEIAKLAQRFSFGDNNQIKQKYSAPALNSYQSEQLREYIKNRLLPFYEIWQKILDQNKYFAIETTFYQPVKIGQKQENLLNGKKLQINELLGIQLLKQYVSDKPPLQEKKDPKKK